MGFLWVGIFLSECQLRAVRCRECLGIARDWVTDRSTPFILSEWSWLNVQSGHNNVGVIPIDSYVRRDNSDQPMLGDFVGALKSVASESPYCLPKTPIGTS